MRDYTSQFQFTYFQNRYFDALAVLTDQRDYFAPVCRVFDNY